MFMCGDTHISKLRYETHKHTLTFEASMFYPEDAIVAYFAILSRPAHGRLLATKFGIGSHQSKCIETPIELTEQASTSF